MFKNERNRVRKNRELAQLRRSNDSALEYRKGLAVWIRENKQHPIAGRLAQEIARLRGMVN